MIGAMSEPADPALIGRRVAGKFVIEQFLGGGSMGAVYRARDDTLDRNVALKVMHPSIAVDPNLVSRFHREARAASRLDHPSSMHVIEFGEEPDGLLYIAMEYLEGRELYKVILEDWPLSDARIADIVMKALGAIAVAHEMGVIHRDLKPENIMILHRKDDEGHDVVKVCDFGIAKITERDANGPPDAAPKTAGAKLTTAGLVVGTPEYMSPEQARGEKLDARSDLYSMGIILYQLLTGRTPFVAETPLAVALKHISETPDPPKAIYPGVHPGLEAVCMRALAKHKEDRFQSAREMRAALKAAIEGQPVQLEAAGASKVGGANGSGSVALPSQESTTSSLEEEDATTRTPLVTEHVMSKEKRPRATLLIAVALIALALGTAGVVARRDQTAEIAEPNTEAPPTPVSKAAQSRHSASAPSTSTFDPGTCRAVLGAPKSLGNYSVRSLTLRGTDAAWTTCAKATIKEKLPSPLFTTVRVQFNLDKAFRGATCMGCTPSLAQCVASSTGKTVSVSFNAGAQTGHPEFDVPVTFSCDGRDRP